MSETFSKVEVITGVAGSMLSMPYSIQLNDIPVFLDQGQDRHCSAE